jgi:hypothetical protein
MKGAQVLMLAGLAGCSFGERQTFTGSIGAGWDSAPVKVQAKSSSHTYRARVSKTGTFELAIRGPETYRFSVIQADGSVVPMRFSYGSTANATLHVVGGTKTFNLGRVNRLAPYTVADAAAMLDDELVAKSARIDDDDDDGSDDDNETEVCDDDDDSSGDNQEGHQDGDDDSSDDDSSDDDSSDDDSNDDDGNDDTDEAAVPANSPPSNIGSCDDDDDSSDDDENEQEGDNEHED